MPQRFEVVIESSRVRGLLKPCTPPCGRRKLELDKRVLGLSKRALAGRLAQVARTLALVQRSLACCRSAWGSSCHIECGGLKMEPGTWGRLERGRLERAPGRTGRRMELPGSLERRAARSRRCRLVRMGLRRLKVR